MATLTRPSTAITRQSCQYAQEVLSISNRLWFWPQHPNLNLLLWALAMGCALRQKLALSPLATAGGNLVGAR